MSALVTIPTRRSPSTTGRAPMRCRESTSIASSSVSPGERVTSSRVMISPTVTGRPESPRSAPPIVPSRVAFLKSVSVTIPARRFPSSTTGR